MPSPTKAYNPAFEVNFILSRVGLGLWSCLAWMSRGFSGSCVKKTWHSNTWEHQHSEDFCRKAYGENCQDKTIADCQNRWRCMEKNMLLVEPCWTTESCSILFATSTLDTSIFQNEGAVWTLRKCCKRHTIGTPFSITPNLEDQLEATLLRLGNSMVLPRHHGWGC